MLITSSITINPLTLSCLDQDFIFCLCRPSRFLPPLFKTFLVPTLFSSLISDMIRLMLQVVCGLLFFGAAKSSNIYYDCSRPTFDTGKFAWLSYRHPFTIYCSLFHLTVKHSAITVNRFDSDGASDYFEY